MPKDMSNPSSWDNVDDEDVLKRKGVYDVNKPKRKEERRSKLNGEKGKEPKREKEKE